MLQLDWKTPSVFICADPTWKQKIFMGGLWLFFPGGWLIALGYRKEVVMNLVWGKDPILPVWKSRSFYFLQEGCKAMGVILSYFLPWFGALWFCALDGASPMDHWQELLVFFALVLALTPVFLPTLPWWYDHYYTWFSVSPTEKVLLSISFVALTFVIPAGFMQVARRGRFTDALNPIEVFLVLRHHFLAYTEAWFLSLCMTAGIVLMGPFAPWGVIWSYQGIVYSFNEVLANSSLPRYRERMANSCFAAFRQHRHGASDQLRQQLTKDPPQQVVHNGKTYPIKHLQCAETGFSLALQHEAHSTHYDFFWSNLIAVSHGRIEQIYSLRRHQDHLVITHVAAMLRIGALRIPMPLLWRRNLQTISFAQP